MFTRHTSDTPCLPTHFRLIFSTHLLRTSGLYLQTAADNNLVVTFLTALTALVSYFKVDVRLQLLKSVNHYEIFILCSETASERESFITWDVDVSAATKFRHLVVLDQGAAVQCSQVFST